MVTKDLWTKFIVTTLTLWITVPCCARKKKTSIMWGFESSEPVVVNHEQGSQDSNNVKTKDESSGVLRETVASPMRETPASSKSSSGGSGGSSNPVSVHPRTKSIYIKKEIPKEDRIWTTIPGCQKCKRDSFETRISKCVTKKVRHHDQDEREAEWSDAWEWYTSGIERKIPKATGKRIHRRGLAPLPLSWEVQDEVWNL